jgi:hypothetical protein
MTIEELEAQALAGDPLAQYDMALQYYYGGVVKKNRKLACDWATKAVRQYIPLAREGDANAQFMLGKAYWDNIAFRENMDQCIAWIVRAKDQGSEAAANFIKERSSANSAWKDWAAGFNLPAIKNNPEEDLIVEIKKKPSGKLGGLAGAILLCLIGFSIGSFFLGLVGLIAGYFAGKWAWKKFILPRFAGKVRE